MNENIEVEEKLRKCRPDIQKFVSIETHYVQLIKKAMIKDICKYNYIIS